MNLSSGFLEISVHTPQITESLAFYESLGFAQATTGEAWSHPYAVVTDGRVSLGLHASPDHAPALTFVAPRLARAVEQLRTRGVDFDREQLADTAFNEAVFRDPAGQQVRLIEARTFSPPALDVGHMSACGYFMELGVPARETDGACAFWEPLGFIALEEELTPFARTVLTSDRLNLALYPGRAFRQPVLTFEDPHMRERLSTLRERGFVLTDEMPDALDELDNAVLVAPEGTRLLLLQSQE